MPGRNVITRKLNQMSRSNLGEIVVTTTPYSRPVAKNKKQKSIGLLQEVLMKRLGSQAHIINLKLNHAVPASVRLLPAKEYRGAAIGINYDLRVYTGKLNISC